MGRIEERRLNVSYLNRERKLRIYIPEKYDKDINMRFPVLYVHDGQNMYVDQDATYGCSWKAKDSMELLEGAGKTNGIIIVAIDNDEDRRLDEYSPWENEMKINLGGRTSFGGDGDQYCEFVVNELKPFIDKEYRTISDREHTAIAGSSMGGYISVYIAAKYPDVFSKIGAFSTASWFNETEFMKFLDSVDILSNQRYFVQVGTREGYDGQANTNNVTSSQRYIDATIKLQSKLLEKGVTFLNLRLVMGADEYHNEIFWAKHFPAFVEYIYC